MTGDSVGLELLLHHEAAVDFNEGCALQAAASGGSLEVLDLLLASGPTRDTLRRACIATVSSPQSWAQKQPIFEHLLTTRDELSTEDMSELLAKSVTSLPNLVQLLQLLTARGAEVRFETLKVSLETSSSDLFAALVSFTQSANTIRKLFRHALKTTLTPSRRYWIYNYLLGRGIPEHDLNKALLAFLEANELGDISCLKLLLEHDATDAYKKGSAFDLALRANSVEAVRLLSQYIVDDSTADLAFRFARTTPPVETSVRLATYRSLLQWNICRSSLSHALKDTFKDKHEGKHFDLPLLQLLLAKGADPNQDASHCFVKASTWGAEPEFRALSRHAKPSVVLKALLDHFNTEEQAVRWPKICLEEQPDAVKIDQDELLFQCIRKFPSGTALLKLFLNNGVPPSAKVDHSICTGWDPERCTALIWALFLESPKIGNEVILMFLAQCGDTGL